MDAYPHSIQVTITATDDQQREPEERFFLRYLWSETMPDRYTDETYTETGKIIDDD